MDDPTHPGANTNPGADDAPAAGDFRGAAQHGALTRRIGDRVRKAREMQAITRKALAARSGVSLRYLAEIETGRGNTSVALLARVAGALGLGIEHLISEDDPWTSAAYEVSARFRAASDERKQAVLEILGPPPGAARRAERVALIGLRGAGKSTLGRRLAVAASAPFVELNNEIERESGVSVADLIALYGQEGYRRLEAQAIARIVATRERVVLAVAGGIVGAPDTFSALLNGFHAIWLKASPDEHMDRVRAQGDHRPMAGNPAAMDQLRAILTSREEQYRRAAITLDTSGWTEGEALSELEAIVAERRLLG